MTKRLYIIFTIGWLVLFELGYELAKYFADNGMFTNHHYIQIIMAYYFMMGIIAFWLDVQRKKLKK